MNKDDVEVISFTYPHGAEQRNLVVKKFPTIQHAELLFESFGGKMLMSIAVHVFWTGLNRVKNMDTIHVRPNSPAELIEAIRRMTAWPNDNKIAVSMWANLE